MNNSTYLRNIKSELYERKYERFRVNKPARIITINTGLSGISMRSCQLNDISLAGASFTMLTSVEIGQHYYLNIVGYKERFGCIEIYKNKDTYGVQFISLIDPAVLRSIIRSDFFTAK